MKTNKIYVLGCAVGVMLAPSMSLAQAENPEVSSILAKAAEAYRNLTAVSFQVETKSPGATLKVAYSKEYSVKRSGRM